MIIDTFAAILILLTIIFITLIFVGCIIDETETKVNFISFGTIGLFLSVAIGWGVGMNVNSVEEVYRPTEAMVNVRPNFLTLDSDTETLITIHDIPTYNRFVNVTNKVIIHQIGKINNYNTTNWYSKYKIPE